MQMGKCTSKWALLGGVNVNAALALAAPAQAAGTTVNLSITCTSNNAPFAVSSDTPTIISEGATVVGSNLSAVTLNSARANLRIGGTVSATCAAALTVRNGEPTLVHDPYAGASFPYRYLFPYHHPTATPTIVVAEQGNVSDDTGIVIERPSSNYLGGLAATMDTDVLMRVVKKLA